MTTIATDGKSMAGDGQREMSRTIVDSTAVKVRQLSDGRLYGSAGEAAFSAMVVEWLEGGSKPDFKPEEFVALVLSPSGEVHHISEICHLIQIDSPAAIGSGIDFALGAMAAGASVQKAVEIACKYDPGSGGKITVLEVQKFPRALSA